MSPTEPQKTSPVSPTPAQSNTEIVGEITVKNPAATPGSQNQISAQAQPSKTAAPDKEFDQILQKVTRSVAEDKKSQLETAQQTAGSLEAAKKRAKWWPKLKAVLPLAAAMVAVVSLSVAAVFAFKDYQNVAPSTHDSASSTSSPASNTDETPVTIDEVGSFAESLNSEFGSLDDSQDFNGDGLGEAALGI